jgi:hypothetical protein
MKAMDPNNRKSEETNQVMQQIVSVGLVREELRDEIFVQVIKQMTLPKDGEPKGWEYIVQAGWQLLGLATSTFPPSKVIDKSVIKKIASNNVRH